jgi:hypothetical protein
MIANEIASKRARRADPPGRLFDKGEDTHELYAS